jgi:ribosomal protein S18 acetylase RimI-like enzyme
MNAKQATEADISVRPLTIDDFDAVVAIDAKLSGTRRENFYTKRLEAALAKPKDFIYVGVDRDGVLAGFAFVHLLAGEFGGTGTVAVLDAIGVDPAHQDAGLGQHLVDGLIAVMKNKNVREMQTEVDWTNHSLLRFLDANGFVRAPRIVLERGTAVPLDI